MAQDPNAFLLPPNTTYTLPDGTTQVVVPNKDPATGKYRDQFRSPGPEQSRIDPAHLNWINEA
ncbi:MAG: hypothetical protein AAF975_09625, partial [Spirochaetota bacterium]